MKRKLFPTLTLLAAAQLAAPAQVTQLPAPEKTGETFVVDDFDHKVTAQQGGTNYFGGNMGLVAFPRSLTDDGKVQASYSPSSGAGARLQVAWDFTATRTRGPFAGFFLSLFGLTDTKVRLGASTREPAATRRFPGYFVDFDNFFGGFLPLAGRSIDQVVLTLAVPASQGTTHFKLELTDEAGRRAVRRFSLAGGQTLVVRSARIDFNRAAGFDWKRVNAMAVVIESHPAGVPGGNPASGTFFLDDVLLEDTDGAYPDLAAMAAADGSLRPEYAVAFLEIVRERSFQYFLDFAAAAAATGGVIQDRSPFADLLTVGGVGFQIPAYIMGIERGYLARGVAAERVRKLLRVLLLAPQGPQALNRSGYQGFFYHFLGPNGRRKLNFDFNETTAREDLNTVELSTIDTALALCGILIAERYFDGTATAERDIRTFAQKLFARVDWTFMFAADAQQLALGWKPNENRENAPARFLLPDAQGKGAYSSRNVDGAEIAATLDYYTDEAVLAALLAMAAPKPEFRLPRAVWDAVIREGSPFVKSFGGPLFTYQFGAVFLDTSALGADNHQAILGRPALPLDFAQNTRAAIVATRDYATANPFARSTLGMDAWGLTATEGPFGKYSAYAAPTAAVGVDRGVGLTNRFAEGEAFQGAGSNNSRGAASGQTTRLLHTDESATFALDLSAREGLGQINVRYSNDGPPETITVLLDGTEFGHFTSVDTRPAGGVPGDGWNVFRTVTLSGARLLAAGPHTLAVQVSDGDTFGWELDAVTLFTPLEDGTICPYGLASSLPFLPAESLAALWRAARTNPFGHPHSRLLHPRFGFADAYNAAIEDAAFAKPAVATLRTTGPWMHLDGFAIDHGPLCLLIDRYLEGPQLQNLFMTHPLIQPVLQSLFPSWTPPAP